MTYYISNTYNGIYLFIILSIVLSTVIILVSYILSYQKQDNEKISAYECGFSPFDDARSKFDVKFYLVSILFIIFDIEVSYLFPWVISLPNIGSLGFWSMVFFFFILTIGFIYEWMEGALDWS